MLLADELTYDPYYFQLQISVLISYIQEKYTNRGLLRRHLHLKHNLTDDSADIIIKGDFSHLFDNDEM